MEGKWVPIRCLRLRSHSHGHDGLQHGRYRLTSDYSIRGDRPRPAECVPESRPTKVKKLDYRVSENCCQRRSGKDPRPSVSGDRGYRRDGFISVPATPSTKSGFTVIVMLYQHCWTPAALPSGPRFFSRHDQKFRVAEGRRRTFVVLVSGRNGRGSLGGTVKKILFGAAS
jgi:hypothetical protein